MTKLSRTILLVCATLAPLYASASPISSAEIKFREQMALADYQSVEYRDEKGAPLTFEQFQELLPNFGFRMEKKKNGESASAVVKLQSRQAKMVMPKFKLAPGAEFPQFKLNASDGSLVDNAALQGRYTVVNFYFAECAPCIKEVPMLNEFAARNKEYGTLAVTFDTPGETKRFAQRTSFNWRTVSGASELLDQVGVKAYPSFALLDPKGMVVAIATFNVDSQGGGLDKWVAQAIAGRAH